MKPASSTRLAIVAEKVADSISQKLSRIVGLLLSWRHPGFSVYQGESVPPEDTATREHLARYILHAPFSQERVSYDRAQQTVACESKKKNAGSDRHRTAGSRAYGRHQSSTLLPTDGR